MPKIYVKKAFRLQHKGETHEFPVGNHSVPADVAEHWLVKAHIGDEPQLDPDTSAAADELLAELEAKAKQLDAREQHVTGMEKAMADHMTDLTGREEVLATRAKEADERAADLDAREKAVSAREQAMAAAEKATAEAASKQAGKK